jgi:catalase
VIGRFSLAGPNPMVPDTARNPRALALQFQLPNGELHQMAMLNTPVFGAATVESFYQRQLADIPDATGKRDPRSWRPTKPSPMDRRLGQPHPPPFGDSYHSLNAFKHHAHEHWIKWRFEPRDCVHFLSEEELKTLPKDFLVQRITDRTRKGPVQWDMVVSLGEAGDPIDNPAVAWPAERKEVTVGTLTLTRAGNDAVGQCEDINFDPNVHGRSSPDATVYRLCANETARPTKRSVEQTARNAATPGGTARAPPNSGACRVATLMVSLAAMAANSLRRSCHDGHGALKARLADNMNDRRYGDARGIYLSQTLTEAEGYATSLSANMERLHWLAHGDPAETAIVSLMRTHRAYIVTRRSGPLVRHAASRPSDFGAGACTTIMARRSSRMAADS